jgi:hypothetical protein
MPPLFHDNLGSNDPASLERYAPRELAQVLGGYREDWADLGNVIEDLEAIGNLGNTHAHPWGPAVMHRVGEHLQHGHHHPMLHKLLSNLHRVMARHADLERERNLWHAKANVIESIQWVGVKPASLSSTATLKAPYSGVNYMILGALMAANLTPLGWWNSINFAGIDFAGPSQKSVTYDTDGTGKPATQGMGFTTFYEDTTQPQGERGWNPWVSWILSSDAVSQWQWYNPDPNNPRSLCVDVLMRSSPCDIDFHKQEGKDIAWYSGDFEDMGSHALNMMYAAVLGAHGHKIHQTPHDWYSAAHGYHPYQPYHGGAGGGAHAPHGPHGRGGVPTPRGNMASPYR